MKNITLSADAELIEHARTEARARKTTLNVIGALFLMAICLLSGCVSGTAFRPQPQKTDVGLVYFYRPYSFGGSGMYPVVKVNGQEVVDLKAGNYSYVYLEPGTHEISLFESAVFSPDAKKPYHEEMFTIAAGETLYYRWVVSGDQQDLYYIDWTKHAFFVNEAQGRSEIIGCKLLSNTEELDQTGNRTYVVKTKKHVHFVEAETETDFILGVLVDGYLSVTEGADIQNEIASYYREKTTLPATAQELNTYIVGRGNAERLGTISRIESLNLIDGFIVGDIYQIPSNRVALEKVEKKLTVKITPAGQFAQDQEELEYSEELKESTALLDEMFKH